MTRPIIEPAGDGPRYLVLHYAMWEAWESLIGDDDGVAYEYALAQAKAHVRASGRSNWSWHGGPRSAAR